MPEPANAQVDSIVVWSGDMIDAYRTCAARHKALSEWARGK
jgi:hypothetical protein